MSKIRPYSSGSRYGEDPTGTKDMKNYVLDIIYKKGPTTKLNEYLLFIFFYLLNYFLLDTNYERYF